METNGNTEISLESFQFFKTKKREHQQRIRKWTLTIHRILYEFGIEHGKLVSAMSTKWCVCATCWKSTDSLRCLTNSSSTHIKNALFFIRLPSTLNYVLKWLIKDERVAYVWRTNAVYLFYSRDKFYFCYQPWIGHVSTIWILQIS